MLSSAIRCAALSTVVIVSCGPQVFADPVQSASAVSSLNYASQINQHFGKSVSPEQNAMVLIMQAFGPRPEGTDQPDEFFQALGMNRPPDNGDYFQVFAKDLPRHLIPEAHKQQGRAQSRPWKEEECPEVFKWLTKNERSIELVIKAVDRKHWYSPLVPPKDEDGESGGLIMTLLPHVQQLRSLARYFACRANLYIQLGETDKAWNDLLSCHKLGRLSSHGPTLIDYLVGVAITQMALRGEAVLLSEGQVTDAQLAKYAADLRELVPIADPNQQVSVTERMMFMDTVDFVASGRVDDLNELLGLNVGRVTPVHRILMAFIDWNLVKQRGHQAYDQLNIAMQTTDRDSRAEALAAFSAGATRNDMSPAGLVSEYFKTGSLRGALSGMTGNGFVKLMVPAIQAVDGARLRNFQVDVNVQLAFSLQRYKLNKGEYPEALSQLQPKYVNTIPVDAFSGGALNYKRTDDGYLLYSVGVNSEDDNGRSYDDTPQGDDLNIRMPVVFTE